MSEKPNFRQRAISDHDIPSNSSHPIRMRICEANFEINIATLGSQHPYVRIFYGNNKWRTEVAKNSGKTPKWDIEYKLDLEGDTIQVVVFHKGFFFSDPEIGRCTICLSEVVQGHLVEWWNLTTPAGSHAGAILIAFEIPDKRIPDIAVSMWTTHNANSSWDVRACRASPMEWKVRKQKNSKFKPQLTQRTPDRKFMHFSTEPDEVYDLDQIKTDLSEENERLRAQELKVKKLFAKLKGESIALKDEKIELRKCKEMLQEKEEKILQDKNALANEKLMIMKEKEEIEKLKLQLNQDYTKLKQDKLKICAHRKVLEKRSKKIFETMRHIERHKEMIENSPSKIKNKEDGSIDDAELDQELDDYDVDISDGELYEL
ncbi:unnamed protein product [Blepharisma stoltei]|uniref:C2 domain-containing protein n=1 Tax=Blepharisma stoltei TaxID=1481888 RepID=A0AAU9IQG2_9CILI|nr:unnamed protein product [Blepharisma stoltei]